MRIPYSRHAARPAFSVLALATLLALGSVTMSVQAQHAPAATQQSFDVPAGPLGPALNALASQGHLQVIYTPELVAGRRAPALHGQHSARAALGVLLRGSGLEVDFVDANTAVLRKAPTASPTPKPRPAPAPRPTAAPAEPTLDAIRVSAGYEPIEKKRDSAVIVESIHFDDIENAAIEESIASMLVQLPGISSDEDGGEPKYVVMRGISPDLNHTTVDGISIATVGEYGSATRRVNLQLIPNDFSTRTDLFKTFTAEQDGGAIGGITDIVTRSAYDRPDRYFVADVFGIYSTYDGADGRNSLEGTKSHWGKGFKSTFSDRFGTDDQFGVVLSARYQSRVANAGTLFQDTKNYFDDQGNYLGAPDRERGWNGWAVPASYGYASYTDEFKTYGGSAKFEWSPMEGDFYGSALVYSYRRGQSRTRNGFSFNTRQWIDNQDAAGGTSRINQINSTYQFDTYDRNNRGALFRLDRKWDGAALSLRAGYTQEWYETDEPTATARHTPPAAYLDYDASRGFPYTFRLQDPTLLYASRYQLVAAADTHAYARQTLKNVRADYIFNVEPGSRGLGFAGGLEWRRSVLFKDVEAVSYATGNRGINDYLYDPGYVQDGASYSFPWIDYPRLREDVISGLTGTRTAASRTADYKYTEDMLDAYASLHYATDRTLYILGLRYDDIGFDAFNAGTRTIDSVVTQVPVHKRGDYQHLLPSLNILHRLRDDLSLRFSYSQTLGRPMPGDIAQAESFTCSDDGDGLDDCRVTRGNPNLKPRRSRNLDVAVEKYFNQDRGLVSLGYFDKKIRDDIFDLTRVEDIDGVPTEVTQPMNADDSSVRGLEMVLMNRGMKIGGGQSLDASFNATYMDGEMNWVTNGGTRTVNRMISQPRWLANAGLTWRIPQVKGAVRLWASHRSDFMTSVGASPWLDKGRDERTTVNLSMWHRLGKSVTLKYEFNNLFDDQPRSLVGENLAFDAADTDLGRSAMFHIIYTP